MPRHGFPRAAAGIVLVCSFLLSACGNSAPPADSSTPPDDGNALAGTSWVLELLDDQPVLNGTTVTLQLTTEGTVAGSAGCNRYNGDFTAEGDGITIQTLGTTLMACEEATVHQEDAFLAALEKATRFTTDEDTLTLTDDGGAALLVFSPQSDDLSGGTWSVTGYNNGDEAVVSLLSGTVAEVRFSEDGTISGSGGCNRFTGRFTAEDATLTVEPLGMTRMACPTPEGVMEQEAALVAALESSTGYAVEGDALRLTGTEGATTVTLART